jgi:hypothetical protein
MFASRSSFVISGKYRNFWFNLNRKFFNPRHVYSSGGFDAVLIFLFILEENELNFSKRKERPPTNQPTNKFF